MNLTIQRLKELYHYDPELGIFTRLKKTSNRGSLGVVSGHTRKDGYQMLRIDGNLYFVHRLAWFYITETWPKEIDHIDGNPSNNVWTNLREASSSQNKINRKTGKKSRDIPKGVCWHKGANKWMAQVSQGKHKMYLGLFDTIDEALQEYEIASKELHGQYKRQ